MDHAMAGMLAGRTRWRRVWLVFVPVLVVTALLLAFIAKGLIAVSFAVSGHQLTITADQVKSAATDSNGLGFYQFGVADFDGKGDPIPQAENIIPSAQITRLCQSVSVGPATLRITAGTARSPVTARNLIIDASSLTATSAEFTNIKIGQDMGTFANPQLTMPVARGAGPNVITAPVPLGTFGQTATGVILGGVTQVSNGVSATTFTLPNLSLGFGAAC